MKDRICFYSQPFSRVQTYYDMIDVSAEYGLKHIEGFNMLDFEECDVLDLFAGTGSISYEFCSRGAKSVTSVEVNNVHYNFIKRTASELGFKQMYPTRANVFLYLKSCPKQFDVIFSDAPYDLEGSEEVIKLVFERELLREGGLLIFEHPKGQDYSSHPQFEQQRSYGSVQFAFFRR